MTLRAARRSVLLGLVAAGLAPSATFAEPAARAELLMFERDGCPWCLRWHQEVGAGYPKSDEGQRAPLRVLHDASSAAVGVSLKAPVTMAPTFVLVAQGREVGRIVGYPGAEFFYGLLDELMKKLDRAAAAPAPSVSKL
jgi:hypothetical protein